MHRQMITLLLWSLEVPCSALGEPLYADPLAWSVDGQTWPERCYVLDGQDWRFRGIYTGGNVVVNAACMGSSGRQLAKHRFLLQLDHDLRFSGAFLKPLDILYGRKSVWDSGSSSHSRDYFVVVDVDPNRLVLWHFKQPAKAYWAAQGSRAALVQNGNEIAVRRDEDEGANIPQPTDEECELISIYICAADSTGGVNL